MIPKKELTALRRQLLAWFRQYQRDLPWRRTQDPYRIWLSEIMLQQTRVAAAIPYYERFLEHFPNVRALAEAPQEEVLRRWSGLGYYSRARNLQQAAQQIVAKHAGQFPTNYEDTLALPGIGAYTVAAILSIAFGEKYAVLDGNVARVIARIGAVRGDLREGGRWKLLQETAQQWLDKSAPGDWNQAMMELGATVCTPKSPQCLLCPVEKFCAARKLGLQEELPEKRKKRASVDVRLATGVLVDSQGRTLLLPPPEKTSGKAAADDVATLVSKMWHFPTIAVQDNAETELLEFLRRYFLPAKNTKWRLEPLRKVRHAVTYRDITVYPFRIVVPRLPQAAAGTAGCKVVALAEVHALTVSNLTRKVGKRAVELVVNEQSKAER